MDYAAKETVSHVDGDKTYDAFRIEMNKLRSRGLVDCKMKLFPTNDTTAGTVMRTMTDALRLLEAGKAKPLTLG